MHKIAHDVWIPVYNVSFLLQYAVVSSVLVQPFVVMPDFAMLLLASEWAQAPYNLELSAGSADLCLRRKHI